MMWEDSTIDREAKKFLKPKENGRFLPIDIVAHLDFFYNTLLMSHETKNPFKRLHVYKALSYPFSLNHENDSTEVRTLLEVHQRLICPMIYKEGSGEDDSTEKRKDRFFDSPYSEDTESLISKVSLDNKKYHWYPNREIDSPLNNGKGALLSPTPKRFEGRESFALNGSPSKELVPEQLL